MSDRREQVLKPFVQYADYMNDRVSSGIEMNRKAYANLRFVDKEGNPVPGAHAEIHQRTHDFKYGANLFMLGEMETEEKNQAYEEYFADCFNLATLPFYWSDLEPEQGKPRYAKDSPRVYRRPAPDLCLEYCEKHGIEPKAHCLVYDNFAPEWAKKDVRSMKRLYLKRFKELSERYADRIPSWEVINETIWAFSDTRSEFMFADDYLEWSFDNVAKYFPENHLILNEYGMFGGQPATTRAPYYMLIDRLIREGKRVDSIGFQFHRFVSEENEAATSQKDFNPMQTFRLLDLYAKFGRPMQITEVTFPAYRWTEEDEDIQAEMLKNMYSMWFSQTRMEAIIYWNLVDGYAAFAPLGDMTSGENRYAGGLLRHDMTPKKAYYTLRDLFKKTWHTEASVTANDEGRTGFKGFYGEYDLEVTANGQTTPHTLHLTREHHLNDYPIVL